MRQETKEKITNTLYPVAMLSVFGALEYFGVGNSIREYELNRLEFAKEFYGSLNPVYWLACLDAYVRPAGLEALASIFAGGLAAASVAEPIKKIINKKK